MTPFLLHVKRKTCKQIVSIRSVYASQFPAIQRCQLTAPPAFVVSAQPSCRYPCFCSPSPLPCCPDNRQTPRFPWRRGSFLPPCLDAVTVAQSVRCDFKAKPGDVCASQHAAVSGPASQDTSSFVWFGFKELQVRGAGTEIVCQCPREAIADVITAVSHQTLQFSSSGKKLLLLASLLKFKVYI